MDEFRHLLVSAPGKVIIHGEHVVVHGRRALACSLNLRTYLHIAKSSGGLVKVSLPDVDVQRSWKQEEIAVLRSHLGQTNDSSQLDSEIFAKICEFCGINSKTDNTKELAVVSFVYLYTSILQAKQVPPLDFLVSSNLPPSAGLGSSAAFSVTLATGLLLLAQKIRHPESKSFGTWSESDLELINSWAFLGEKIIHGNPSGVDNSVSTFGGILKYQNKVMSRLDCKHQLEVLITNTKIPRSTKLMVANVGQKLKEFPTIIDPIMDAVEAISIRCQEELTSAGQITESVMKELISANQLLLSILGVSHPALDKICSITSSYHLTSKLTGAGGGGCAFTYLPAGTQESVISEVMGQLQDFGFDCWKTVVGGPGVGLHSVQEADGYFSLPAPICSRLFNSSDSGSH